MSRGIATAVAPELGSPTSGLGAPRVTHALTGSPSTTGARAARPRRAGAGAGAGTVPSTASASCTTWCSASSCSGRSPTRSRRASPPTRRRWASTTTSSASPGATRRRVRPRLGRPAPERFHRSLGRVHDRPLDTRSVRQPLRLHPRRPGTRGDLGRLRRPPARDARPPDLGDVRPAGGSRSRATRGRVGVHRPTRLHARARRLRHQPRGELETFALVGRADPDPRASRGPRRWSACSRPGTSTSRASSRSTCASGSCRARAWAPASPTLSGAGKPSPSTSTPISSPSTSMPLPAATSTTCGLLHLPPKSPEAIAAGSVGIADPAGMSNASAIFADADRRGRREPGSNRRDGGTSLRGSQPFTVRGMTKTAHDATKTYRDATFISTDSHVTEPIEIFAERVDAEFRDACRHRDRRRLAHPADREPEAPAADARVRARGRVVGDFDADDRLRDQRATGSAPKSSSRRSAAGVFRRRRRRTATDPVSGVQQLGDRGVRRSAPASRRRGVDARHRRRVEDATRWPPRASACCSSPPRFRRARTTPRRTTRSGRSPKISDCRSPSTPALVTNRGPKRPRRRGRQLPHGRATRWPDGDAHDGGRRRARPVPRAASRHRRDRCRVARVDHDAGRRDLRGPQHVGAPEAVAQAERADPASVCGHVHVRPGRDQQPRDHRRGDVDVGQRLPASRRNVAHVAGRRRRPVRGRVRRRRRTRSSSGNAAKVFGFDLASLAWPVPACDPPMRTPRAVHPAAADDPHPVYRRLRQECPVARRDGEPGARSSSTATRTCSGRCATRSTSRPRTAWTSASSR